MKTVKIITAYAVAIIVAAAVAYGLFCIDPFLLKTPTGATEALAYQAWQSGPWYAGLGVPVALVIGAAGGFFSYAMMWEKEEEEEEE